MKLTYLQEEAGRGALDMLREWSNRGPVLKRARAQLKHAVGDALSGSWDALQGARPKRGAERAHQRLLEVVERDRALKAAVADAAPRRAEPAQARPAASPASEPDSGRAEQTVTYEPIRTRTLARLLEAQGYKKRALAIYESLLAEAPEDEALQAEVQRLRG